MSGFIDRWRNFSDEDGVNWTLCLNCDKKFKIYPACKRAAGYRCHILKPEPRKKCELAYAEKRRLYVSSSFSATQRLKEENERLKEENQVLKEIQKLKEENKRLRNCIKKL